MNPAISAQDVCDLLNEARRLDPEAMRILRKFGAKVNDKLADHPTIQVRGEPGAYFLRLVGLLNGLMARTDYALCEVYQEESEGGAFIEFALVPWDEVRGEAL